MEKQNDLAVTNIERAAEIMHRIYHADAFYEPYHRPVKPVVFMSQDILNVMIAGMPDDVRSFAHTSDLEVFGYKVKMAVGIGVLYIGFEI